MSAVNRDPVKRAEWMRNYQRENADRLREYNRRYRRRWVADNRQRHNVNSDRWRKANPEKVREIKQRNRHKDARDVAWLELQKTIAALS